MRLACLSAAFLMQQLINDLSMQQLINDLSMQQVINPGKAVAPSTQFPDQFGQVKIKLIFSPGVRADMQQQDKAIHPPWRLFFVL